METASKKTFDELQEEMNDFFDKIQKNVCRFKIWHSKDCDVAIIRFIPEDFLLPCSSCRVLLSKINGGRFEVYIPSDEIPFVEKRYIISLHFDNVADAYNFVVNRAMEINDFFKH